jgi:hypothetical protein
MKKDKRQKTKNKASPANSINKPSHVILFEILRCFSHCKKFRYYYILKIKSSEIKILSSNIKV